MSSLQYLARLTLANADLIAHLRELEELRARGYGPEKIWLVLNRSTMPGGVSRRDIEGRLHLKFRHTIPDDQALATHSINRGRGANSRMIGSCDSFMVLSLERSSSSRG